jgi:hypothetical protein
VKGDVKKGVFWLLAAGSRNWLTQLAFAMGTPGWGRGARTGCRRMSKET